MPINFIFTNGSCADRKEAIHLIKNINAKLVFTDRDCRADKLLDYIKKRNIKPVNLPERNYLYQRGYKGFKEKKQ